MLTIFKNIKYSFRPLLGRWRLENETKTNLKADYANNDHSSCSHSNYSQSTQSTHSQSTHSNDHDSTIDYSIYLVDFPQDYKKDP